MSLATSKETIRYCKLYCTSINDSISESNVTPSEDPANSGEKVEFKVIYNKKKYDVNFPLDSDVGALKSHLQSLIGIPPGVNFINILRAAFAAVDPKSVKRY